MDSVRIYKAGNPILAERSTEVVVFDDALRDLIANMASITLQLGAIGLAAVQIGKPVRVIVGRWDGEVRWMVNPERVGKPFWRSDVQREGCLSVDERTVWVERPVKCEIRFQDAYGNDCQERFDGMWSRILQHEMDHLDGTLIIDREYRDSRKAGAA